MGGKGEEVGEGGGGGWQGQREGQGERVEGGARVEVGGEHWGSEGEMAGGAEAMRVRAGRAREQVAVEAERAGEPAEQGGLERRGAGLGWGKDNSEGGHRWEPGWRGRAAPGTRPQGHASEGCG